MAARALATATVNFGLVSIPVRLFSSTESSSDIGFHLLHETCHTRLKQQYVCPKDEVVVGRDEMVKGYEFARGQYVVFSPEELKALEMATTRAIEITEFVPIDSVDPIFFERAYFLGPDKGGERAFKLLAEALTQTGLVAIARHATRGKEQLVLVRPHEDGLLLHQLRWNDEVRSASDVSVPEVTLREGELELAVQFVTQLQKDSFDAGAYHDEVKARVQKLIDEKIEGKEITVQAEAPPGQLIDLMDALRRSLGQNAARGPSERKPARRTAKAARKKRASRK